MNTLQYDPISLPYTDMACEHGSWIKVDVSCNFLIC